MFLIFQMFYLVQAQMFEYHLWNNYGQVIYDYSGRGLHGTNGDNTNIDSFDCLFTDRGVYLSKFCMIQLPNFAFPNPLSIVFWVISDDTFYPGVYNSGRLFCRWSDPNYIFIFHNKPTSSARLECNLLNLSTIDSPSDSWKTSKFYIDEWVLIILEINQNIIKIKKNNEVLIQLTHSSNFDDSVNKLRHINIGTDNSMVPGLGGFVWYVAMFSAVNIESQFLSTSSSACFVGSCSECNPSFVIPSLGTGCGPKSVSTSMDSKGNACPSGYGCKGNLILNCNCPFGSCEVSSEGVCFCIDLSTGNKYQSLCNCISVEQGLYQNNCVSCSNEYKCLTCDASFIYSNNGVCLCKDGYFNSSTPSSLNCSECMSECSTCVNNFSCTSCIDIQAELLDGRCYCKAGYFLSSLENQFKCSSCLSECKTCNTSSTCLECKDTNAILNIDRCECKKGFFGSFELGVLKECIKCNDSCSECSSIKNCSSCTSSNTEIIDGVCVCKEGYWSNFELTSFDSCKPCQAPCKDCKDLEYCVSCINENFDLINGTCICKEEFYQDEGLCKNCIAPCNTCLNLTYCKTCSPKNSFIENGICVCTEGYYQKNSSESGNFQCDECAPTCKICTSFNNCQECKNTSKLSTDKNNCECIENYFMDENGECVKCNETCATCKNKNQCLTCPNETLVLVDEKCLKKCSDNMIRVDEQCICEEGFKEENNSCVEYFFYLTLKSNTSNKLSLVFNEPLKSLLIADQISVTFQNNQNQKFQLFSKSTSQFLLILLLTESIKNGTKITVELKKSIYSIYNASLEKYKYTVSLYEYEYIDPIMKALVEKSAGAIKTMASTSIGFMIISNPAASWALIGTLQLLPYIPMSSNYDEKVTRLFFTSVGGFNLLPNFFTRFFSEDSSSKPRKEFRSTGIETSVFWINIGKIMLPLIVLIILWPFIFVLSRLKLGKFTIKLKDILKNYRYGVFIRFWIQAYIDLGVFAIIALQASLKHSEGEFYFNQITAGLTIFLVALTPAFFAVFLFLNYEKISEESFISRYGTFFSEFKNDKGILSIYFYVFYFIRRFLFILTQLFLNFSGLVQSILNLVSGIFMIFYILKYRPFKDFYAGLSNIVTDLAFSLIFISYLIFSTDNSLISEKIYQKIVVFLVTACICSQYLICLILLFFQLKEFYIKLENLRNKLIPDQFKPIVESVERIIRIK